MVRLDGICALALLVTGCSSGVVPAHHDAGGDVAGAVCAQALPADACTSDAAGSCRRTWADVLSAPPVCQYLITEERRGTCGAYDVVEAVHDDWTDVYYYAMDSGQLVAVYTVTMQGTTCNAGPPGGLPDCQLIAPPCQPAPATDAGTS